MAKKVEVMSYLSRSENFVDTLHTNIVEEVIAYIQIGGYYNPHTRK